MARPHLRLGLSRGLAQGRPMCVCADALLGTGCSFERKGGCAGWPHAAERRPPPPAVRQRTPHVAQGRKDGRLTGLRWHNHGHGDSLSWHAWAVSMFAWRAIVTRATKRQPCPELTSTGRAREMRKCAEVERSYPTSDEQHRATTRRRAMPNMSPRRVASRAPASLLSATLCCL